MGQFLPPKGQILPATITDVKSRLRLAEHNIEALKAKPGGSDTGGIEVTFSDSIPDKAAVGDVWYETSGNSVIAQYQCVTAYASGTGVQADWAEYTTDGSAITAGTVDSPQLAPEAVQTANIASAAVDLTHLAPAVTSRALGSTITTVSQTQPSSPLSGDLWIQTNASGDVQAFWTYNGTTWVESTISIPAGGGVQITASTTAPSSPNTGDLWIDESNGNALKQWNGSTWTAYQFGAGAIATGAVGTTQLDPAVTARTLGSTTTTTGTAPPATGNIVNDTFIDAASGQTSIWDGSNWLPQTIDAGKVIQAGTVQANTIAADAIDGKVINSATINSGTITASDFIMEAGVNKAILAYNATTGETELTFTNAGTYTWTVPTGVSVVKVECWGGGGGGGAGYYSGNTIMMGGLGGGGGEFASELAIPVTAGTTYTMNIGTGGEGGNADSSGYPSYAGTDGSDTSMTLGSTTVIAHGGKGGPSGYQWYQGAHGGSGGVTVGAAGGTGSTNAVHANGGAGGINLGGVGPAAGAGGGSSAGKSGPGVAGGNANHYTAGAGGVLSGTAGAGGTGDHDQTAADVPVGHATPGFAPGGGGGGGEGYTSSVTHIVTLGASGGTGMIRLTYTAASSDSPALLATMAALDGTDQYNNIYYQGFTSYYGGARAQLHVNTANSVPAIELVAGTQSEHNNASIYNLKYNTGETNEFMGLIINGPASTSDSANTTIQMTSNQKDGASMPSIWVWTGGTVRQLIDSQGTHFWSPVWGYNGLVTIGDTIVAVQPGTSSTPETNHNLTLINGWATVSAASTPYYRRMPDGTMFLGGQIYNTTSFTNGSSIIGAVPSGYYSPTVGGFGIVSVLTGSVSTAMTTWIDTSGNIHLYGSYTGNAAVNSAGHVNLNFRYPVSS